MLKIIWKLCQWIVLLLWSHYRVFSTSSGSALIWCYSRPNADTDIQGHIPETLAAPLWEFKFLWNAFPTSEISNIHIFTLWIMKWYPWSKILWKKFHNSWDWSKVQSMAHCTQIMLMYWFCVTASMVFR